MNPIVTPIETNMAALLPEEQAAWATVHRLRAELTAAEARRKAIDEERQTLDQRIRQLRGGFRGHGEIERAEEEARIAGKPKLPSKDSYTQRTILRVEGRWIVVTGWSGEQFYDRETGKEKGRRSDLCKIDPVAALAAWSEYERRVKEHIQTVTP